MHIYTVLKILKSYSRNQIIRGGGDIKEEQKNECDGLYMRENINSIKNNEDEYW